MNGFTMRFDMVTNDCPARSEPSMWTCPRSIGLPEYFEYMWKEFGFDSDTRVAYAKFRVPGPFNELNGDTSSFRRELDCVCQQVPYNLLKAVCVSGNHPVKVRQTHFYAYTLCFAARPDRLDRRLDNLGKVDGLHIEPQLSTQGPRNIEEIIYDLYLRFRISLDQVQRAGENLFVLRVATQHIDCAQNGRQRRPQFVRDAGHELVLQP